MELFLDASLEQQVQIAQPDLHGIIELRSIYDALLPTMLVADSHIRRLGTLDLAIQREQSLVLDISRSVMLLPWDEPQARRVVGSVA